MNVLQAIVLYGVTVSSYNQVEPFYDQVEDNQIGEVDSEAEDEPQGSYRLNSILSEIQGIISLTKMELIDFHKSSNAKLPISSVILGL